MKVYEKLTALAEELEPVSIKINCGGCGIFALQIKQFIPNAILYRAFSNLDDADKFISYGINEEFNHFILKINGRYFDSEGFIDANRLLKVNKTTWTSVLVRNFYALDLDYVIVKDTFKNLESIIDTLELWNPTFRRDRNLSKFMTQSINNTLKFK